MASPTPPKDPQRPSAAKIGSLPVAIPPENSDGRHARRDRGKQIALEATLEIFREGGVVESMAQLAERSGISERTLFRYFTNQDGLIDAVAGYVFPQMVQYFTMEVPDGTLQERIRALVELRIEYAQTSAPMARTVERFARQFSIAAELRRGRDAVFYEQLLKWLGDDASTLSEEVVVLIDTLLSFNSLDKILSTLGARSTNTVFDAVMTIITSHDVRGH